MTPKIGEQFTSKVKFDCLKLPHIYYKPYRNIKQVTISSGAMTSQGLTHISCARRGTWVALKKTATYSKDRLELEDWSPSSWSRSLWNKVL